jgi:hypothetical protein
VRSILTFTAALFAAVTVLHSAAIACISCEYVPPVVYTPAHSYVTKHYKKRRSHGVHRRAKRTHMVRRRYRSRASISRSHVSYPTYQPYRRPYNSADSYLGYQH